MPDLTVVVAGRGVAAGDALREDGGAQARCDLCGNTVDAVARVAASSGTVGLCTACLRSCLEAITIARYRFREGVKIPWGKMSG
jgi:hypothetical protein